MADFNIRKFLTENKLTKTSKILNETYEMGSEKFFLDIIQKYLTRNYPDYSDWFDREGYPLYPVPDIRKWVSSRFIEEIIVETVPDEIYLEDEDIRMLVRKFEKLLYGNEFAGRIARIIRGVREDASSSDYDDPDQYDNWASSRGVRGGRMFEKPGEDIQESDYSDYLDTHYSSDGMDDYYSDKASKHTAEVLYTVGYELHKIGRTEEAESYRQQALDVFPEWTERDLPPY